MIANAARAHGRAGARAGPRLIARFGWRELLSPRYLWGATAQMARRIGRDPLLRAVFVLLLALDGTLMILHWYQELGLDASYPIALLDVSKLNMIDRDSYLTGFDIVKSVATVVFLAGAWIASRAPAYLCSALASLFIILFGTTYLHSDLGEWIAQRSGLASIYPEMGNHMVEAAILAVVGIVLLALIAFGALNSRGIHSASAVAMAVVIISLGFFAGGIDLFHALTFFELNHFIHIIAFIEEAGEALSLTCALVFAAAIARLCSPSRRST